MRYLAPLLVLILFGASGAPSPSSAQAYAQPYGPRQGVQSGEVRALGEILDSVRRQHPGYLADVQGPNIGPRGEPHYRLKWVSPDGRVQWLDTDARTGRVLGVQGAASVPAPAPRPGIANGALRRGAVVPHRQNFGGPIVDVPPAIPPGFRRGADPGFGRGPGPGPGFGRGGGPAPNRGPGGVRNRFRSDR